MRDTTDFPKMPGEVSILGLRFAALHQRDVTFSLLDVQHPRAVHDASPEHYLPCSEKGARK